MRPGVVARDTTRDVIRDLADRRPCRAARRAGDARVTEEVAGMRAAGAVTR